MMKKYLYSSLLVLAGGVLLANTTVAYADSPSASEKEAITQLVNQGKIKAEEADQVKLIGFEDKETQAEGNQEKKAFNQYRDPKGTWMQTNGKWWFKYGSGGYAKNWEQLDGKWYYFDDQGWMKENTWIQPDGNYYYLSASGAMVTGYQRVNGTPYFFRDSGVWVENRGQALGEYAETFVGKIPYVWGGADLDSGVDCSGFTVAIHAKFDISIPRVTYDQATGGSYVSNGSQQAGDLILYNSEETNDHVGIYVGGGKVVHAPYPGRYVSYMDQYGITQNTIRRYW